MLSLYREAISLRRQHLRGGGDFSIAKVADGVLQYRHGPVSVQVNMGEEPVPLVSDSVLITSDAVDGKLLPVNTAAWMLDS